MLAVLPVNRAAAETLQHVRCRVGVPTCAYEQRLTMANSAQCTPLRMQQLSSPSHTAARLQHTYRQKSVSQLDGNVI